MKIYWSIKSVPELQEMSDKEREAILHRYRSKAQLGIWAVILLAIVVPLLTLLFCIFLVTTYGLRIGLIGAVIWGLAISFISVQLDRRRLRHHIRDYLEQHSGIK